VTLAKPDCMLMASVQTLGPDSLMVAETLGSAAGTQEAVCLYDVQRALESGTLSPLATFSEHTDIITCMAGCPSNPNICFAGSKDCIIKLWDKRSVGSDGLPTLLPCLPDQALHPTCQRPFQPPTLYYTYFRTSE
jgi:WD40 repeat protein